MEFCFYLSIFKTQVIIINGSTALLLGLGRFFSFSVLCIVGRTTWTTDQLIASSLPSHKTTQAQNKDMLRV
jgi:hypothetical protein